MVNNKQTFITELYISISPHIQYFEFKRDYKDVIDQVTGETYSEEVDNNLTELENQILNKLNAVDDLCRKHPEFWEPNPKDNPEMFDSDGDLLPDLSEVKSFDFEEHKRIEAQFDSAIRNALKNFTKDTHLQKKAFAESYGIAISYLSRIISGDKDFDFKKIVSAGEKLGCTLSFSPADKTAKFVKKI